MSFMHAYIMYFFCVLVIKVATMYYEQLLAIVLKEFKCMNMWLIIINPWPLCIEIYEYFDKFINFCTSIDAWVILFI
jgi:hypothetical protein